MKDLWARIHFQDLSPREGSILRLTHLVVAIISFQIWILQSLAGNWPVIDHYCQAGSPCLNQEEGKKREREGYKQEKDQSSQLSLKVPFHCLCRVLFPGSSNRSRGAWAPGVRADQCYILSSTSSGWFGSKMSLLLAPHSLVCLHTWSPTGITVVKHLGCRA